MKGFILKRNLLTVFLILLFCSPGLHAEVYLTQDKFLGKYFQTKPDAAFLWLDQDLREKLNNDLQEVLSTARLRYWQQEGKRAWILEKVGRDKPITLGFIIENGRISHMDVLVFRESRGYEIHYESFTQQLENIGFDDKMALDKNIDNITGATLSVNAVRKTARLALYLDAYLDKQLEASNTQSENQGE